MPLITNFICETIIPPSNHYVPERDIPDLTGKVILVTGGNSGIGKECIKHLLLKNAKVYMGARSKTKAQDAIAELKSQTGKEAIFLQLDLADLASINRSVDEFESEESTIDILYNSGGIMATPIDQLTADGYDLQFGTNVLGHAHLTLLLLANDVLKSGSKVIHTSSALAYMASPIDYETLKGESRKRTKLGPEGLYQQSKMANYIFSCELARRYGAQGIRSNTIHPGLIRTPLGGHLPLFQRAIVHPLSWPMSYGPLTQLYAGTSPETADANGKWFTAWAREGQWHGSKEAVNEAEGKKLWEWIEEQRKEHL